jgi:hypothetical protein
MTILCANDHFHQENNEFKIWRAYRERGPRYLNLKTFTGYLTCLQFRIATDILFLFSLWLDRAHQVVQEKLCFTPPTFKEIFSEKAKDTIISKYTRKTSNASAIGPRLAQSWKPSIGKIISYCAKNIGLDSLMVFGSLL